MKRGYPLENRSYQSDDINYKFTGKPRDAETGGACPDTLLIGNYFGARYYDARIGRWGGVEPLLEKNLQLSPYCYSKNNPEIFVDPTGQDAIYIYFVSYRIEVSSGVKVPFINHAGVMLFDNKTGEVNYYQFGRYGKNNKGLVEGSGLKPIGIENGKLNEKDISDRLKSISQTNGKGSEIEGAYIQSDKYDEMNRYAEEKMDETKQNTEDTYKIFTNNCAIFAADVIQQGENVKRAPILFYAPKHFSMWYRSKYNKVNYNEDENKYEIDK